MSAIPADDDLIDIFDIVLALWRRKWVLIGTAAVIVLAGVAYALLAQTVFRSEAVLAPVDRDDVQNFAGGLSGLASLAGVSLNSPVTNSMQAVATLRSRAFIEDFIVENELMPVLFDDEWNESASRWVAEEPEDQPNLEDAVDFFSNEVRFIREDANTGLITLAIEWKDAALAKDWVDELIVRINEKLRSRDLIDSERRLEYLNQQLDTVSLVESRQAISRLIENEIQTIMLANAEAEYAFHVIDPPRVPRKPVAPRRILIVALSGLLGIGLGMFVVWILSAIATRQSVTDR